MPAPWSTVRGYSDALGTVAYGENQEKVFLGHSVSRTQNISEDTSQKIDEEVKRLVGEGLATARKLLTTKNKDLVAVAEGLLDTRRCLGEEIKDLIKGTPPKRDDGIRPRVRQDHVIRFPPAVHPRRAAPPTWNRSRSPDAQDYFVRQGWFTARMPGPSYQEGRGHRSAAFCHRLHADRSDRARWRVDHRAVENLSPDRAGLVAAQPWPKDRPLVIGIVKSTPDSFSMAGARRGGCSDRPWLASRRGRCRHSRHWRGIDASRF